MGRPPFTKKSDNSAALRNINSGWGRVAELAVLAKSIRLKEIHLAIESAAVHIPGQINITPRRVVQVFLQHRLCREVPDKTLLFQSFFSTTGAFNLDGMCADGGHNALVDRYCTPPFHFSKKMSPVSMSGCFRPSSSSELPSSS